MKLFLLFTLTLVNIFSVSLQEPIQNQPAGNNTITSPHRNVWRALSEAEFSGVSAVLVHQLNLTTSRGGNRIIQIDYLYPNKSDVLLFLDHNGEEPKRYARATVQFGSPEVPYLQEYRIGPLPATNTTAVEPLRFPFNGKVQGKTKITSLDADGIDAFLPQLSSVVEDITRKLWNTTLAEGGVSFNLGKASFNSDSTQTIWLGFLNNATTGFDSSTLLPLGVSMQLDITSRDYNDWFVLYWFYNNKLYTPTSFNETVYSSDFQPPLANIDGPWTSTNKQEPTFLLDDLPPPKAISRGKNRYNLDTEENYVQWMDFSFYFSSHTDRGLSLFNVVYKSKRIIYELSLQEALAHYAGVEPVPSEAVYFDTQTGMGRSMISLIKGYDCPDYATYLNSSFSSRTGVTITPDAICLFESDSQFPLRRHTSQAFGYASAARNVVFTVRWIATVGNYDYLFDYDFFYDGAIEVKVRASGYIQGAYYAGNEEYGFKIHDALSGSMHDHVMTFKADLDIYGEKNSVQKVEVVPETTIYPWSQGQPHNTMKLNRGFVTSETDSSIDWAADDAISYTIVNKDSPNKYGEYPGYRFRRVAPAIHLTVKNSTSGGKALHYATHDLFITQQKDNEPCAADRNNAYNIDDPLVDFEKFLDGESLEQEDLVLWINMGMHHTPHTEDLPNTIMTSAYSGIRFEPFNYLESGDPSVKSAQQARIILSNS
ncbi:hypothetical protein COCVIDRAFT_21377 [Bipolaris victoriae FI3]|uniref:Copper amine oxidase vicK1 n=1 Tax=Bipolaris victoriae (strain FI3) TaxID=930091 RepID=VICK1_BIPV3|nr:hypothetical protein COCVIDRAFT_21377 [Bipolaris victoriae FI3]W7E8S5.1 RecName: Full=Copper amine oxidase vicK1; Short=CAO vicK1; AltName: Full=Victorin biosynthesis cluster protein K1; Flags: Precursor [Bipolaris victoriae FI3]